ncbi:ABC transporter ATP-binding protein [Intestinibacillus sp. Marseille-P6563]|uniref:ABC transporter ATP-binding protein n=1 Tax=Intestinibacillus sp. Marseille-P6563 TaxID=2364792 RepID=UPI000F04DBDA|nr:ABC transporter ATP-binding protein [Intestinibacillus sp. Marseille-P6563]
MEIVQTQGLCKRYGDAMRVRELALSVPEGTVYGFLGPNGAGKSTTLKMILGLAHPTAGQITVFGQPLTAKNRLSILRDVGSLIESPSYYGHLTGEENLRIVQTLRGAPERNIAEVLQIVRLTGQKDKKVAHYSLGMKQRLGLASALLGFPKLLILDEPTNGLDPAGIQEMRELICELPKQFGMTVLVSSHLLSEIDQMADVVGIIANGELVFQDRLERLHARSRRNLALRTSNNAVAGEWLSRMGIQSEVQEDYLLLPDLEDAAVRQVGRALVGQGIDLLRLELRENSLEDIFLELTGGKAASL